ncbi:MAG: hypothetical protein ACR2ND_06170 [Solirubrobacteraceae bacterium]
MHALQCQTRVGINADEILGAVMGSDPARPIRVVSGTIKDGVVNFNQVVMERDAPPVGVLLAGIDPDEGIAALWLRPLSAIEEVATTQISGYSRHLRIELGGPPEAIGEPVVIRAAAIDAIRPGLRTEIVESNTNTKNKLVREAFGWF